MINGFKIFSVLFVMLGSNLLLAAKIKIIEVKEDHRLVELITNEASKSTLVVFDVDYVLFTPKDLILRPAGEINQLRRNYFKNIALNPEIKKDLKHYLGILQTQASIELVNTQLPQLTRYLVKSGFPVVALSANKSMKIGQVSNLLELYKNRLDRFGYRFNVLTQNSISVLLKEEEAKAEFIGGLVFTGRIAKGKVLRAILQKAQLAPSKVVLIDDRLKYLKSAQDECKKMQIPFLGLHYTKLVSLGEKVDKEVSDLQFETLVNKEIWLNRG